MKHALRIGIALLLASAPPGAHAAGPCLISVTPLSFGRYDPRIGADLMSTGRVAYSCPGTNSVSVIMDRGGAPSVAQRRLRSGAHLLAYNIYMDAAGTIIWGDGTGGSQFYVSNAPGSGFTVGIPFYGRIPGGQTGAWIGTYTDTVVVTIRF